MATKAEIQTHIAKKLRKEFDDNLTGAYVRDSVAEQITINDWNSIATWLQARDFTSVGNHIAGLVRATIVSDADSDAAAILADDVVDLAEYARIEGL